MMGGLSYGYLSAAVTMLVGLWLTPFLLRALGSHELGLWLLIQQAASVLLLMDVGVVALLPRETAYATGRAGGAAASPDLAVLVGETQRLVWCQLPIVAAAALVAWVMVETRSEGLRWPAAIVLASFVALFPSRVFPALLHGLQDHAFVGRTQLIVWTVNTMVTVALVWWGFGLISLVVAYVVSQVLLAVVTWLRVRSRFPGALPDRLPPFGRDLVRRHMGRSIWVSVSQVAQVLLNGSDILIVGAVMGPAAVVVYSCTSKLVSVLANQPQMIMQTAAPALSEVRMAESASRLSDASLALTQAMLLVSGAVACVVAAVNGAFVTWWVGPAQYAGFRVTALLVVAMLLRHLNVTTVYALFARGYEKQISLVTLADGAVTVAVTALAVRQLGVIGAPIGVIAGTCLVSLPLNLQRLARDAGSAPSALLRDLAPWAARFLLVLACAVIVALGWQPAGLRGAALSGAAIAAIYLALAGPLALRHPLGMYVRPWLAWR